MFSKTKPISIALPFLLITTETHAQRSLYKPCPLLGPSFPAPTISSSSPPALDQFTQHLEAYLANGTGTFGPITPNTTSFSIGIFAGDNVINDSTPLFHEYHHGANGEKKPDKNTVYVAGDLTQIFTVVTLLAELGVEVLERSIVDFLPELDGLSSAVRGQGHLETVAWRDVTLGALAGHMAGIARDSDACRIDQFCDKDTFLTKLAAKPPVYLTDTTPTYSHAAYQLLALAIEKQTGRTFEDILSARIVSNLSMTGTSLLTGTSSPTLFGNGLSNSSVSGEPASLSLLSSTHDLAIFGHALLTSSLLPQSTTRRWLKPFSSTSNIANAVGRPWEIYHYHDDATDPIIDIYTKSGTIGKYSSYFGLAPSLSVGFSILAVNDGDNAADLNAYADMLLFALLEIDALAREQAKDAYVGTYKSSGNSASSSITLNITDSDPGLAVTHLMINGTDWLDEIAQASSISPAENIDFRLYPTDLVEGNRRAWRAVIQDMDALVDAGTPTCISWQTVGALKRNGLALDDFVLELDEKSGLAKVVESKALDVKFERTV